jgi:hypothetical protein
MAPTTSPPPVAGAVIATPAVWWDLPLDPATRDADIASLVDRRIAQVPAFGPRRAELVGLLTRLAEQAYQVGALLSSHLALVDSTRAVTANLLVAVRLGARSDLPLLDEVRVMDGPGHQAEVSEVRLPSAGDAVRRLTRLRVADREFSGDAVLVQFFVPVPGSADLAVLTFTSPNVAEQEPLVALFDGIAATLTFVDEAGEPVPVAAA